MFQARCALFQHQTVSIVSEQIMFRVSATGCIVESLQSYNWKGKNQSVQQAAVWVLVYLFLE